MKRRILIAAVVLAVLAGTAASFIRAERFRDRIHRALEQALHRRVDIDGEVTFGIWNGPGFSISKVAIHEDPAVGIEPFAYVEALDASLSVTAMLMGRWEVTTIVLDEPTVTLSQSPAGSWSVRRLLATGTPAGMAAGVASRLPEIRVRGGRINLKFGDTKSVLYFLNADLDLEPQEDGLRIRFSMEPARTDRPAQGFGTLRGRGRYLHSSKQNVDLDLELDRSALSEIANLLEARGGNFRGFLAAKAKVQGPLDALKIEGSMRLEDIQRWDLLRAASGNWPLQFRGSLNFPAGELDLETSGDAGGPFRLRLLGHTLLDNPSWGAIASCKELPVTALRDLVQYLGLKLPERVALDGKLSGVLGYSRKHGLQGMVQLPEAAVKAAGGVLTLRQARFALDGEQIRMLPASLVMEEGTLAEIEGEYRPAHQFFSIRTGDGALPLKETLSGFQQFLGANVPALRSIDEGAWRGVIRYERSADEDPKWTADLSLRDARISLDGLAVPVSLRFAAASIQGERVSLQGMKGSAGDVAFTGSYHYLGSAKEPPARGRESAGRRPHRLQLFFEQLEAGALESIFEPTLHRGSLLRTLSFRPVAMPEWLKERHVDAAISVDSLWSGDTWLGSLQGHLLWDAGQVHLERVSWEREDSEANGGLTLQLNRSEPFYRLTGEVKNFPWKGGGVDGDVDVTTSGTGIALVRNARSLGTFVARDLAFQTDGEFRSAAGKYELSAGRGVPQLKLDGLEVSCGGDVYTGRGGTEGDGKLRVELASGLKKMHLSGTLWPFQLDVEPLRP